MNNQEPEILRPNELSKLREFASDCGEALIEGEPIEFFYPEGFVIEAGEKEKRFSDETVTKIKGHPRNASLLSGLKGTANIYAIFTKASNASSWEVKYVGQRKAASIRERLSQHLIKKNARTGSKLSKVHEVLSKGEKIGVRVIKVEPDSLRTFVEEEIISAYQDQLNEWNIQGVDRKRK